MSNAHSPFKPPQPQAADEDQNDSLFAVPLVGELWPVIGRAFSSIAPLARFAMQLLP